MFAHANLATKRPHSSYSKFLLFELSLVSNGHFSLDHCFNLITSGSSLSASSLDHGGVTLLHIISSRRRQCETDHCVCQKSSYKSESFAPTGQVASQQPQLVKEALAYTFLRPTNPAKWTRTRAIHLIVYQLRYVSQKHLKTHQDTHISR